MHFDTFIVDDLILTAGNWAGLKWETQHSVQLDRTLIIPQGVNPL